MELTTKFIRERRGCGRTVAEAELKAIIKWCNKGEDYIPLRSDFADYHQWSEAKVLFYTVATNEDILNLYKEELKANNESISKGKTIVLDGKYAGNVVIHVPPYLDEEKPTAVIPDNKMKITPHGKLEKEKILKKEKTKKK